MLVTLKERVDRHDREIAAIRKLLQIGMRMQVKNEEAIRKLAQAQRETDRLLKETDRQLNKLIRSLEAGSGNGHESTRVE